MGSVNGGIGKRRYGRLSAVVAAGALVGALAGAGNASAGVSAVGGGAFGAQVRGLVNVGPVPSVTLPAAGGGPFTAFLASVNVPNVLKTGLLEVSTAGAVGDNGFSESSARVLNVKVGTGVVTADAVTSRCRSDSSGSTGSTELLNAFVGGISVDANVAPNTVINLSPVAIVYLNEQNVTNGPNSTSIVVNAIRVVLFPTSSALRQEVIVAQSRCSARLTPATTTTTTIHEPPTTTTTMATTTTTMATTTTTIHG